MEYKILTTDMHEKSRIAEVVNSERYYEEKIKLNSDYYTGFISEYDGGSRGMHAVTTSDVDYSSISSLVGGFYEERKFYAPQFYSIDDSKDYFGTYFWQADIRTDTNGESAVFYNPEKRPFGKIRIEGITKEGIPFAKEIKMY